MTMISSAYYGIVAPTQPSGMGGPQPSPETTTPIATAPEPGRLSIFAKPTFWVVLLVGLAIGLVHVSIRLS